MIVGVFVHRRVKETINLVRPFLYFGLVMAISRSVAISFVACYHRACESRLQEVTKMHLQKHKTSLCIVKYYTIRIIELTIHLTKR